MNWQDSNVADEPKEPPVYLAEAILTSTPVGVDQSPEVSPAAEGAQSRNNSGGWTQLVGRGCVAVWQFVKTVTHWCFGFLSLIIILSVLATIPIVQFLSLGYLLEAGGRVAKSGKLRQGFGQDQLVPSLWACF